MLAVQAEGKAEEISLPGIAAKAVVGEITEFVGSQIQYGERLHSLGSVGPETTVEKNGKMLVGRDCHGSWKVIRGARFARNAGEELSIGNLQCWPARRILRRGNSGKKKQGRKSKTQ